MENAEYRQWLDSLKVGDKVAVKKLNYNSTEVVFTEIVKITPQRAMRVKLNMLGSSDLFKDGSYSGSKWDSTTMTIVPITPELIQQEERKKKATKLRAFGRGWDTLDGETIDKVYELVFKAKQEA